MIASVILIILLLLSELESYWCVSLEIVCNKLIFSILFRSNVEWRRRKIRMWEPTFYEVCQKKVLVFWVVIGKLAQVRF